MFLMDGAGFLLFCSLGPGSGPALILVTAPVAFFVISSAALRHKALLTWDYTASDSFCHLSWHWIWTHIRISFPFRAFRSIWLHTRWCWEADPSALIWWSRAGFPGSRQVPDTSGGICLPSVIEMNLMFNTLVTTIIGTPASYGSGAPSTGSTADCPQTALS